VRPDDEPAPSSLEDAVIREISDRSPSPGSIHPSISDVPPIVEPSQLRPRSSNPPEESAASVETLTLPSIPPDAIVPDASSADFVEAAPSVGQTPMMPTLADTSRVAASPSPAATAVATKPEAEPEAYSIPVRFSPGPPPVAQGAASHNLPEPSSPWRGWLLAFAVLGLAIGIALFVTGNDVGTAPSDLPAGVDIPQGYGYVEVSAAPGAAVRLDGIPIGRGPNAGRPAAPGSHEVSVELEGRASTLVVEVHAARTTHVKSGPP
jgi:hypothetical protein